ncbi:nuclear pore complex protein NUP107 isoform X1 [Iris pallida]|uniref:Nuclear pore complex protein NUP107 isoform X1 n=1 Tax=Iris pallida TaxID=29817 RepID=A0AAX6GUB3_IRIPA|nr:nuclear pore complex protein NUP107 isoform X1 [Iris pallida]
MLVSIRPGGCLVSRLRSFKNEDDVLVVDGGETTLDCSLRFLIPRFKVCFVLFLDSALCLHFFIFYALVQV